MDTSFYLSEGPQTELTALVEKHAERVKNLIINDPEIIRQGEPYLSIHKTCEYIFYDLPFMREYIRNARPGSREDIANNRLKNRIFRSRTLHQLLEEGHFPSCSEFGLLFRGLMIAQGHPTAYVDTFHKDFLLNNSLKGHVFGRVFFNDKPVLVNPQGTPVIVDEEFEILPYVIFREGLDNEDIEVSSYDDMYRLKDENLGFLLERYERNLRALFGKKIKDLNEFRRKEH